MQTLQFKPYTENQLREILEKRVQQAFRPGTVPNEVIKEIAETVADQGGDCRQALKIILRTGRRADQEGRSEVATDLLT